MFYYHDYSYFDTYVYVLSEYSLDKGKVKVTDQMLDDFERDGYVIIR